MRIAFNMDTNRGSREARTDGRRVGVGSTAALGAWLARRGLKHSRQRERIAEVFFGLGGHVSVDELLIHARRRRRRRGRRQRRVDPL